MLLPIVLLLILLQQVCAVVEVIVIGAGPSGLAAATKLYANNVKVTILEAESRIGGRVNSVPFGDAIIDLGAEWCHGQGENVVYKMVKDLNVLGHGNYGLNLFASDRRNVDKEFNLQLQELFTDIFDLEKLNMQAEETTIGQYFIKEYNASIYKNYKNDPDNLYLAQSSLEHFHHYVLSSDGSFSWFDTSVLNDFKDTGGDVNMHWNGHGFKTALDVLLRKYPKQDANFQIEKCIYLKKEVRNIRWDQKRAAVSCSDGSMYYGDHVIFTPSLGVLKNQHRTLFSPTLPLAKIQAVEHLGIGAVMKVIMQFPARWWPKDNFSEFDFVWTLFHKEMLIAEFPRGPSKHGRSWLLDFFTVYGVENNPNVLSAWFTGEMVPEIEMIDDDLIVDGIMFVMDKFLGHKYNISRPTKILRTKWYTNPHFRGTYSFQTVESRKQKPSSNEILSLPLYNADKVPILLFAGEATHPYHYSTVHGAIESGHREADRILMYNNKK